jgi:hypothetical protein
MADFKGYTLYRDCQIKKTGVFKGHRSCPGKERLLFARGTGAILTLENKGLSRATEASLNNRAFQGHGSFLDKRGLPGAQELF